MTKFHLKILWRKHDHGAAGKLLCGDINVYAPCKAGYAVKIKSYILNSTEMTVEELLKLKEDLSFLGFTIDDLNEIENEVGSEDHSSDSFDFTWDNLLKKFCLPRVHKYSEVPDGVLTFDFET